MHFVSPRGVSLTAVGLAADCPHFILLYRKMFVEQLHIHATGVAEHYGADVESCAMRMCWSVVSVVVVVFVASLLFIPTANEGTIYTCLAFLYGCIYGDSLKDLLDLLPYLELLIWK